MKDEIKEIVRLNCEEEIDVKYFAKDDSLVNTTMDYSQLLDYITSLQEENERLKEIVENLTTMTASGDGKQIKNTAQFKLDICKQRINKAIELISKEFLCYDNESDEYIQGKRAINILNGGEE